MERGLSWVLRGVVAMFALLTLSLGFWSVVAGPGLMLHPKNPRLEQAQALVRRGGIYARGGEALSVTFETEAGLTRSFVGPLSTAHVVGYSDPRFGRTGLEASFNHVLLGMVHGTGVARVLHQALGLEWAGWDLVTTLDAHLQEVATRALDGRKGAIVALDPHDGSILAMVSHPTFDPAHLEEYLSGQRGEDAALFNRATQGQYPPGSVFKPVVMAVALEAGIASPGRLYLDEGVLSVGGRRIQNVGETSYGELAIDEALAYSSNVVFARLAGEIAPSVFRDFVESLGLGRRPSVDIPAAAGRMPTVTELDDAVLQAEVGIGQGPLLVTPLQMAVVTAAFANGGWRVEPGLISTVRSPDGSERAVRPERPVRVMAPGTAHVVKEAMVKAAQWGTAREATWPGGPPVAGKTGTAENPHGEPHAWFIGFFPAHDPRIAVAVVVENGGYGGVTAAPIARQLFAALD